MSRRRVDVARLAMLVTSLSAAAESGCAATSSRSEYIGGTGGGGAPSSGASGGAPSQGSASGGGGAGGFNFGDLDAGSSDATDEVATNPCGSECGPMELCDTAHLGLDDNCNGLVDESCACSPGAVHWCFEGDPAYHNAPGCFDGVETCSELGTWGPCIGGVQAVPPDNCFLNDTSACHAITAPPYATTDLETGTGTFSANAVAGSETFTVQCPTGVSQCPAVSPPSTFEAIQSGEYTVTYTKTVAGDASPLSCTFPLFIGAPGLRVELSWEHFVTDMGVDLDLHVHEPVNTQPWSVMGEPQDCTWSSCKFDQIDPAAMDPAAPHWFPDSDVIPLPVNWDLSPILQDNTCYNDPHGVGAEWAQLGMGCHNPRQDIDEIQCDDTVTDPNNPEFCAPENNNIDYPPNDQWVRVGVHYYYNHGETYDVHPEIKVFCNGSLFGDLGPQNYYVPQAPVTFAAADGAGTGTGNRFWIAADVAFTTDSCGVTTCVVQPIYADPTTMTPYFTLDTQATATFFPAWPAPP
jgi:hypothetical protein